VVASRALRSNVRRYLCVPFFRPLPGGNLDVAQRPENEPACAGERCGFCRAGTTTAKEV
jgi:hypothetical protein